MKTIQISERDSCGVVPLDLGIFSRRIDTWRDTVKQANERFPNTVGSIKEETTVLLPRFEKQQVVVKNEDTINMGIIVRHLGYNPVLLNFSDDVFAGVSIA